MKLSKRQMRYRNCRKKINAKLIDSFKWILVYGENDLLKYAEAVGENVKETGYVSKDGNHHISFAYNGYEFGLYVSPEKLSKIREKVLPPTKVTEPNHEK